MKKNIIYIGFILFTNTIVYLMVDYYARLDSFKETSTIYKEGIANYIVWLSQHKPKKVQKAMANQVFFDIVDFGKNRVEQNEVSYICKSWNQGLNGILTEVYLRPIYGKDDNDGNRIIDLTDQTTSLYLKGANKLDITCKIDIKD